MSSHRLGFCVWILALTSCGGGPMPPAAAPSTATGDTGPASPSAAPPVAQVASAQNTPASTATHPSPSEPVPTPQLHPMVVELVPGRVKNAYPSKSTRGVVNDQRTADGWRLHLTAQPSTDPTRGEWAGFCWDIAAVDGSSFTTLGLELPEVTQGAEVEVKLEREKNDVMEAVLRFLQKGEVRVDLTSYPRVRPEIARLCIMAIGRPAAKGPTSTSFVFKRAWLE